MNARRLAQSQETRRVELATGSIARMLTDAPKLREGEVHLWRLPLDRPAWPRDVLRSFLTADELARAEKFIFPHHCDRFIASRGYLRLILAQYRGCGPRDIQFELGAHGKPYLADSLANDELAFNISHTYGSGLCAVSRGRDVGVDVEQIRSEVDILGIARSTFSPAEYKQLESLAPRLQLTAFYACWTRKEAYIKARGDGLSYPLDAFDVSFAPGDPAALLRSDEGLVEQQRWSFFNIDAGPGFASALVVERPVARLRLVGWV